MSTVNPVNLVPPLLLETEQELFHVLDGGGGGRKNAVGDPPPAAGKGRGVAAVGPGV